MDKNDVEESTVTMTVGQFLLLRDGAVKYRELLDVLFDGCTIGYDGELSYNDKDINGYLKFTTDGRYYSKLMDLKDKNDR